jgi:hypothetical protein
LTVDDTSDISINGDILRDPRPLGAIDSQKLY